MNPFGMESTMSFAPPPPQVVQKQNDSGKNGLGIFSTLLDLAALIPGPQQPFVAGASAAKNIGAGAATGNPKQMLGGVSQFAGLGPIKELFSGAEKFPYAFEYMPEQYLGTDVSMPFNPYQYTNFYPFGR